MLTLLGKFICYGFLAITLFTNYVNAKNNELKVAIFVEPPFVDSVDDTLIGENIDIAKLIAKAIDFRLSIIRCPFARCMVMVESGQADMIIGIKKTAAREENLIFIEPAILTQNQPLRFFTLDAKNLRINNLSDLDGLVVGILRGSAYFKNFDGNSNVTKVEITTQQQLVSMLLRGHIDTFLDREESIIPLLPSHVYQQNISLSDYQYNTPVKGYIAISKNSHITLYAEKLAEYVAVAEKSGVIQSIRANSRAKLSSPVPHLK